MSHFEHSNKKKYGRLGTLLNVHVQFRIRERSFLFFTIDFIIQRFKQCCENKASTLKYILLWPRSRARSDELDDFD
jgi:hypothetical protein